MKLKADSAELFFVVCTKQFMNGVITPQIYRKNLESLCKMMKQNTKLYSTVVAILAIEGDISLRTLREESQSNETDTTLVNIFRQNENCLYYQGTLRITDPDPWPSIPHIHIFDKRINKVKKINIYTGESTEGASYSKNELISLWNDPSFVKKMSNNLDTICSKPYMKSSNKE